MALTDVARHGGRVGRRVRQLHAVPLRPAVAVAKHRRQIAISTACLTHRVALAALAFALAIVAAAPALFRQRHSRALRRARRDGHPRVGARQSARRGVAAVQRIPTAHPRAPRAAGSRWRVALDRRSAGAEAAARTEGTHSRGTAGAASPGRQQAGGRVRLGGPATPRGVQHAYGVRHHVATAFVQAEHDTDERGELLPRDDVRAHGVEASGAVVAGEGKEEVPEVIHARLVGARQEVEQRRIGRHHLVQQVRVHAARVVVQPPVAPHLRVHLAQHIEHQLGLVRVGVATTSARPRVGDAGLEEGGKGIFLRIDDVALVDAVLQAATLAGRHAAKRRSPPPKHRVAQAITGSGAV
mmetsp:Transcript_12529/g.38768  ORF Transcript_12529/g.38768 Transcript_12529/m.38768 type:complete len:355 (+) Transcript_12529:963-2027(+)